MKKIYIICMCLILITVSNLSFAEKNEPDEHDYIFELLDREDGLSNLSVSHIIQDKFGFMWFSTQGGLNYYNGREMKVFRTTAFDETGLVHNLIQTMYYDEDMHELWIGTYQGISHYIIESNIFENFTVENNNLSNPVVTSIVKDSENNIWVGTLDGLNKLEKDSKIFKQIEIPEKAVRSLLIDSNNQLLLGTHNGLYSYNKNMEKLNKVPIDLPSPYVMVVKEFEKGLLTLGWWSC